MKVLICIIAPLIATCSAGFLDFRSVGGEHSGDIVKDLKVIEVVRQNNQHVSTVVQNIKVAHNAQHPKLQDVKAIRVLHQTKKSEPQILQRPHDFNSQVVKTIQIVEEHAVNHNVNTGNSNHRDDISIGNGEGSGGSTFHSGHGALSEINTGSSSPGASSGNHYSRENANTDDGHELDLLETLKIIGVLSPHATSSYSS